MEGERRGKESEKQKKQKEKEKLTRLRKNLLKHSDDDKNPQLDTATASRSRGSTRGISVEICRLSRWRVRDFSFLSFFLLSFLLFGGGGSSRSKKEKKLRRKRSLLSFLSLTFFSLILLLSNNRIRHGRLLAPQQAGERLGASAVRTEGERERRWTGSVL